MKSFNNITEWIVKVNVSWVLQNSMVECKSFPIACFREWITKWSGFTKTVIPAIHLIPESTKNPPKQPNSPIHRNTLGAETFAGRNFREKRKSRNYGHKLSQMTFFPANFVTKTFAIEKKRCISAWKNFRDWSKVSGKTQLSIHFQYYSQSRWQFTRFCSPRD